MVMDDLEITRAVSLDYRTAQIDFRTIVSRLHPLALSTFLLWLDHKVSEFKAFGHVILEEGKDQTLLYFGCTAEIFSPLLQSYFHL